MPVESQTEIPYNKTVTLIQYMVKQQKAHYNEHAWYMQRAGTPGPVKS